jgi:hypothetical protein
VSEQPNRAGNLNGLPALIFVEILASYSNTAPQVVELVKRVYDVAGRTSGDGASV